MSSLFSLASSFLVLPAVVDVNSVHASQLKAPCCSSFSVHLAAFKHGDSSDNVVCSEEQTAESVKWHPIVG